MENKIKHNLKSLTKSDLDSLAKDLGLKNAKNTNKNELINQLMNSEYSEILKSRFNITWWKTNSSRLYKIIGVATSIITFVTFCNPIKEKSPVYYGDNIGDVINNITYTVDSDVVNKSNDELIELLRYRAKHINKVLENYKEEEEIIDFFLKEFNQLHSEHIKALEKSQSVLAHDILNKIHSLIDCLVDDWNLTLSITYYKEESAFIGDTVSESE